ncbi:MAG TPA: GMC family oxidoreductase [bacterium]|nr:GMC family oxidoreductase [bacterium]
MKREYDVVIVGSGAGGGTVADRLIPLARAGARIAVLEAGPHFTREYFTQREIEMMGLLWHNGAWPVEDGSITLAAGKGVGGSTIMYTGVTFRLPDAVCVEWNVPGITPDELRPRFERLERELNVIEPGEDMVNDNNRLFKEGCDQLGWPVEKIRLNLKDCDQNGFCNLGCTTGGKQGTMELQIPRAVAAGIELVPNCEVDRVNEGSVSATVRPAPAGTVPGPWPPGKAELKARAVVLAAGCPGTTGIMMRSGMDDLPLLGRYITMHPALTVYGIYPRAIKNYRGFPKTYYTPKFSLSHGYYIETAFYYPFISTKHLGLWGQDLKETMKAYTRFMTQIVLNHDPATADNRVVIAKNGALKLRYKIAPETVSSLCHAQAQATRIFFAAGCEQVIMPCADRPIFKAGEVADEKLEQFITPKNFLSVKTPLSSAHPQGGCRMGAGPDHSVTDPLGRVHGRPWLHVADASLFPSSSHVNPYLTIMALAERVAEQVAKALP